MSNRSPATRTAAHPEPTLSLDQFISIIERELDSTPDSTRIAATVQRHLASLIRNSGFLAPEFRIPAQDCYRSHLVALAPSKRFSVMSLVWLPGQATPIHDHICWCVVGVLQGREYEERFSLREDASGARWLVRQGADVPVHLGETSTLVPPEENIHRVRNGCDGLAISIHVYGADLSVIGTSINQRFDDLPIHGEERMGSAVAWRLAVG